MARVRLKQLAESPIDRGFGLELPYVALEHVESYVGRTVDRFEQEIRNADDAILFEPGDVLFGKLRPYLVKVLNPDHAGCASGEFLVLRPRRALDSRFLYYLCLSRPFTGWADATSYGVKMPRTTWEAVGDFEVDVRSLQEQRAIADFLDRETARIDALIRQKRELVRLLTLRRGAVRANAVLGRIGRFSELVATGDPTLPELPNGWRPVRLRHVAQQITVGVVVTPSAFYTEEGLPFIRGFNVRPGVVTDDDLARISPEGNAGHPMSILRRDDVLVVRTGQAGAASVVPGWAVGGNCVDVLVVRCGPSLRPKFLEVVLNSEPAARQIETMSVGAIQSHFNVSALRELVLPLPPTDEQDRALGIIQTEEARMARLIELGNRQVQLLEERRQAVIDAAVTGQIDIDRAA